MDRQGYVGMLTRAVTRGPSGRSQIGPLAVLFVMLELYHEHPGFWEVGELMALTGCNKEAVVEARRVLPVLGVACVGPGGRGLRLTDSAIKQLELWQDRSQVGLPDLPASVVVVDQDLDGERNQQQQQLPGSVNPTQRPDEAEVRAALLAAGVLEPTQSELARDLWVTVERVMRTAAAMKRSGGRTGMIVLNLRGHVEPPRDPEERNVGREWADWVRAHGYRVGGRYARDESEDDDA